MKTGTIPYIWEKIGNIAGAAIYVFFALAAILDFIARQRVSSLLALVLALVVGVIFLVRETPKQINLRWRDWIAGLCGGYMALFLRPAPEVNDMLVLQILQGVGIGIAIIGVLALNTSFGMVAANRGVKTSGIYRYIRHPIYTGYIIQFSAYWAQNITTRNTIILFLWIMFEIARIFIEEQHLSRDPAYANYMQKTRWRLLPYVF